MTRWLKRIVAGIGVLVLLAIVALATWEPFFASSGTAPVSDRIYSAEIVRSEFGVPHIYGKTDADVAFGVAGGGDGAGTIGTGGGAPDAVVGAGKQEVSIAGDALDQTRWRAVHHGGFGGMGASVTGAEALDHDDVILHLAAEKCRAALEVNISVGRATAVAGDAVAIAGIAERVECQATRA